MSTQTDTKVNTPNEVIEVQGNKLIQTVKGIIAKGNIGRLVIYWANGDKLLDIPYAGGLSVTALVTLLIPPLAALTPIALLLGRFKIEIVRPEEQQVPTSEEIEAPSEPEVEVEPTSEQMEASSTKAEVEVEIEPVTPAQEPEPDQLQKITGIGNVFERRLHEAGIYTFAQLAEQSPEKIKEIVSPDKVDQLFDVESWIDQARELSQMAF